MGEEALKAKRYLERIGVMNEQIKILQSEIREVEQELISISAPPFDRLNVKSSGGDKMAALVAKIDKLTKRTYKRIDELVDEKNRITEQILDLGDKSASRSRSVYMITLFKRYVEGASLESIAVDLNMDYSYTTRIHKRALEEFGRIFLPKQQKATKSNKKQL